MEGWGWSESIFENAGGVSVDFRGRDLRPAASRLFIATADAELLYIPLYRAYVRYGSSLALTNDHEWVEWRRWFGQVLVPLLRDRRWGPALRKCELRYLEESHGYVCNYDGVKSVFSRSEIIARFGRSVCFTDLADGIDSRDPLNDVLVRERVPGGERAPLRGNKIDIGTDL
jgi:hypothetical protein